MQHFINISDFSQEEITAVIERAIKIKAEVVGGARRPRLANRLLVMIFEAVSTRTRQSFAAAMVQAGGAVSEVDFSSSQIFRGESLADTARVLSEFADAIVFRTLDHNKIETLSQHATVPVINGLSDVSHPCQILADMMTIVEHRGAIAGAKIAWLGDCNNVLYSWAQLAERFGLPLVAACPPSVQKNSGAFAHVQFVTDATQAARDADVVMTDTWVGVGDDANREQQIFLPYQVTSAVMAAAKPDAVFMHCLPAYRGKEVAAAVLDGAQSVIWQQAANRLHAQKSLILHLLGIKD